MIPVYLVVVTAFGILAAPTLARLHLGIFKTRAVSESPDLTAKHERNIRDVARFYRVLSAVVGLIAMISWFTGFGWNE